ncbi:GNAT family N-acetyltransferase [Photobacterium sp. SDRW27]|uniref:GNAT family N-acetyltransferase n=1 Tax=Photobacterium obscurum TaxID=2829490 RepID=UPI002243A389|nr:GNAT family N-acetyltransferase [Photobacterium obscurum]MCW8328655.1 GNAT family N-acetyltransferase [Photobacterium obscurum]
MIRIAKRTDYAELVSLFIEENIHNHKIAPDRVAQTSDVLSLKELDEILSDPSSYLGVCEYEGKVVGLVLGTFHLKRPNRWNPGRNFAYLEELIVTESMRGKSIAFGLVSAFKVWAKAQGASCIDLNVWHSNEVAIAFYRQVGFTDKQRLMSLPVDG